MSGTFSIGAGGPPRVRGGLRGFNRCGAAPHRAAFRFPSAAGRCELAGRELGERAGAAVDRADELDEVGAGGLEDMDDGAAFAAL
jgi:hypothetical protein